MNDPKDPKSKPPALPPLPPSPATKPNKLPPLPPLATRIASPSAQPSPPQSSPANAPAATPTVAALPPSLPGGSARTVRVHASATAVRLKASSDTELNDAVSELELEEPSATLLAMLDAELALLSSSSPLETARLHLAAARLLDAANRPEAATLRTRAALAAQPGSLTALHVLRVRARKHKAWSEVLELLRGEGAHVSVKARRAVVFEELGRLLRKHGSLDESREALELALRLEPSSSSTLEALRLQQSLAGDYPALHVCLLALAEQSEDPSRQLGYRLLAAWLADHAQQTKQDANPRFALPGTDRRTKESGTELGMATRKPQGDEPPSAIESYVRAFLAQPANHAALFGAERLLVASGRFDELFRLTVRHAQAHRVPRQVHAHLLRAGLLALEKLNDTPSALKCFESALALDPSDELSLRLLIDTYGRQPELWEKLDQSYLRLLRLVVDPAERFGLLVRRADGLLEHGDVQQGIETLLEAERLQPGRPEPGLRLKPLLLEQERIADWVSLCWREAERDATPARADRFVEIAQVCEQHGDIERAITAYREALHVQAGKDSALRPLEGLLRRKRDFATLALLLEAQLEALAAAAPAASNAESPTQARRAALLWELATLYEHKLDNLPTAIEKLQAYRALRPLDRAALWALQRLHQQKNMFAELAEDLRLELELERAPAQRAELMLGLARHEEYRVRDLARAVEHYRGALREQPTLLAAHDGLRRLLRQSKQWSALVDALLARLEVRPVQEHAELLFEIGALREHELGQHDAALEAYERTLTIDEGFAAASEALARLHQQRQRWPQLLRVLQQAARLRTHPGRRANALFRIATLFCDQLNQLEPAVEALRSALQEFPEHTPSLQLLERLLARQEKWTELIALLESQTKLELAPEVKAELALRQGVFLALRSEKLRDALEPLERALGLSPELIGLRPFLETVLAGLGEHNGLAIRLAEQARTQMPPSNAVALLKSAADLNSMDLGSNESDLLESILRLAPNELASIERLEALQSSHSVKVDLLRRRLQVCDGDEALELRLQLAFALRLTHVEKALELVEEVLQVDPRHWPALCLGVELALACEQRERACNWLEQQAESAHGSHTKLKLYQELARWASSMGHIERARNALLVAFKLAPHQPQLYAALRPLFESEQLWLPLSRVLRQHIDALPRTERIQPLLELCDLRRHRLDELEQAIAAAEQVLDLDPLQRGALERVAVMEGQQQHWVEASEAYTRLLELIGPSPKEQREWRLALANLLDEHLARPDEALPLLLDLIELDSNDKDALRLLARVYQEKGLFEDAIIILDKLALIGTPSEAARVKVQQARLSFALGTDARGMGYLREVAGLLRKDVAALDPLLAWADAEDRHDVLVSILDEEVMAASTAAMAESLAPVRMALARILGGKVGERKRAEHESALAAMSAPNNADAQLLAARYQTDPLASRRFALNVLALEPFSIDAYYVCAKAFQQLQWPDSLSRCNQVLAFLGEDSPLVIASANELSEPQSAPPSPHGPKALATCVRHPKLPDWAVELLSRAGPRAQIFVLNPLQGLLPCPNEHPVKAQAFVLAALFGARDFELALTRNPDFLVGVDPEKPERLVLGPRALLGSEAELRFFLGMGIATQVLGTMYLDLLDNRDLMRLLQGLIGLAHEGSGEGEVVKQLGKFLPRKNRKAVTEFAETLDYKGLRLDLVEWRRASLLTSRRAGLLASRDSRAAVECLLRKHGNLPGPATSLSERLSWLRQIPDAGDLLSFGLSDAMGQARRLLNFNRDPLSADPLLGDNRSRPG